MCPWEVTPQVFLVLYWQSFWKVVPILQIRKPFPLFFLPNCDFYVLLFFCWNDILTRKLMGCVLVSYFFLIETETVWKHEVFEHTHPGVIIAIIIIGVRRWQIEHPLQGQLSPKKCLPSHKLRTFMALKTLMKVVLKVFWCVLRQNKIVKLGTIEGSKN